MAVVAVEARKLQGLARLGLLLAGESDAVPRQRARVATARLNASSGMHFTESSRMRVPSG